MILMSIFVGVVGCLNKEIELVYL